MSDEIVPHAQPIAPGGEAEWFPPSEDDTIAAPPGPPERNLRWVFFGADGLRAGWSILLWFLFIALFAAIESLIMRAVLPPAAARRGQPVPEWIMLSNSAVLFLITGLAGYVVARIEGRPWSAYGIGSLRGRVSQFAMGLFWGFATLSALVALLWKTGHLVFGGFHLHGTGTILLWAVLFGISFFMTGVFEEFTFRGFPQFTLTRGIAGILRSIGMEQRAKAISFWITAVLLAIAFGLVHSGNPGEGRLGLVSAGIIGFLFAISLWRTGSLWWAVGFHAAWDWAESYFYGTPDSGLQLPHRLLVTSPQGDPFYSGGTIGPEGSIWVFGAIVLTLLIVLVTLRPQLGSASTQY